MKSGILSLSFLLFFGILSQAQSVSTTADDLVEKKTNTVATRLKLDDGKKKAVYNVFSQTEKRIADLAYGTPDYTKLINYINQERSDMLKVALSQEEYSLYQKFFNTSDNNEINKHIKANYAYLKKKAAEEDKAKKTNEKLMKADKDRIKKEEAKQKAAEKKAAEKQKLAEKKAAAKEKAAEKKEKERLKKEETKRKNEEKKNADKQKALEKKQKELDKKLKKK
jgi:hypothetical protein